MSSPAGDDDLYRWLADLETQARENDASAGQDDPTRRARLSSIGYGSSGGYERSEIEGLSRKQATNAQLVRAYKSLAYACMTRNASAIANLPLRLYVTTRRGEERPKVERAEVSANAAVFLRSLGKPNDRRQGHAKIEEVTQHPILDALAKPNPFFDPQSFLTYLSLCLDCLGNAYVYPTRIDPTWSPVELWPLQAQWVYPIKAVGPEIIDHYQFFDQQYRPCEIVRVRNVSLRDPYLGAEAPLQACFDQCDITDSYATVVNSILKSGARPSHVVSSADPLRPLQGDERKRLELEMDRRSSPSQQGKTWVVGAAVKIDQISTDPVDIGGEAISATARMLICNCFGVPVAMMDPADSNRATSGEATHSHQEHATRPKAKLIGAGLTAGIADCVDPRLFLAFDDPVQRDKLTDAKIFSMDYQNNSATPDEYRAEQGRGPIEGGHFTRAQLLALRSGPEAVPASKPRPTQDADADAETDTEPDEEQE